MLAPLSGQELLAMLISNITSAVAACTAAVLLSSPLTSTRRLLSAAGRVSRGFWAEGLFWERLEGE